MGCKWRSLLLWASLNLWVTRKPDCDAGVGLFLVPAWEEGLRLLCDVSASGVSHLGPARGRCWRAGGVFCAAAPVGELGRQWSCWGYTGHTDLLPREPSSASVPRELLMREPDGLCLEETRLT